MMHSLLKKEFQLTGCTLTYLFIAFAGMTMLPGYPILVGAFFVCLGIFYTFQFAREYNDVLYTALLPVAKEDVVTARFAFVIIIQMAAFALMLALTLLRMCVFSKAKPYVENPMMNANLVFLGSVLFLFALFNLIFMTGFFKTAYAYGKPFLRFAAVALLFIGLMEALHHLPGCAVLNVCGYEAMGMQCAVLALGALSYAAATWLAWKSSIRSFESIDL